MKNFYGESPVDLGPLELPGWTEFMHYLYLPVRIPSSDVGYLGPKHGPDGVHLPERLAFLDEAVYDAMANAQATAGMDDPYVYVTARRGFASPGNPLNRPGMHTDDFGGTDLNYIWSDRFPTRFMLSDRGFALSDDDQESMGEMERMAVAAQRPQGRRGSYIEASNLRIVDGPVNRLLRLTPYVMHDTPLVPEPGGMRSFFKISVSSHRYDLIGNSHNHLLDYDWQMHDRQTLRNQPGAFQNSDYSGVKS